MELSFKISDIPIYTAIFSTIFAGIALILNWLAIRKNTYFNQVKLIESVENQLLEHHFSISVLKRELRKGKNNEINTKFTHFMNTVNFISFLFLNNIIKDKKLKEYFNPYLIKIYEEYYIRFIKKEAWGKRHSELYNYYQKIKNK